MASVSTRPRSLAMTCGKPSVVKPLPSSDTPTLPHTSLATKSAFGLFLLPYCVRNSTVRGRGLALMKLITPPMA